MSLLNPLFFVLSEPGGLNMENMDINPFNRESLTEEVLKEWQNMLNETADMSVIFPAPSALTGSAHSALKRKSTD